MDCFVAIAPRNDDEEGASLSFRAESSSGPYRHCERSDSVRIDSCLSMDCFVAIAPRNDDEEAASLPFEAGSLLAPVVIASGAKQSISPLAEAWIASSLSLLAMTVRKQRRFHLGQGRRPAPIVIA